MGTPPGLQAADIQACPTANPAAGFLTGPLLWALCLQTGVHLLTEAQTCSPGP